MSKRNKDIRTATYERSMDLHRDAMVDTETERMVPASLSSERPVQRWFGAEVLQHTPDAVDLTRAQDGLPFLFNHDSGQPIGLVRNIRVEDGKLRGDLHFSRNARATDVWADVRDGFLKNISIRYQINKWTEADNGDITATRWSLFEASVAPVPADPTVGINRAHQPEQEGNTMDHNDNGVTDTRAAGGGADSTVVGFERARDLGRTEGRAEAIELERARIAEIEETLSFRPQTEETLALKRTAIESGWTPDQLRKHLLQSTTSAGPLGDAGASDYDRGVHHQRGQGIDVTRDGLDHFREGVGEAIAVRAGLEQDKDKVQSAREGIYLSMSLSDMARHYLDSINVDYRGMNRVALVGAALTRGAGSHTTSDFANILADSSRKAMLLGWSEAPENWDKWCRVGSLADFKQASRVGLSSFDDLDKVLEDGEYKYGSMQDLKETLQLATYGKLFRISRQAIINDDLGAFTTIPRKSGRAAARKVGDLAYAVLTTNAALNQDNVALFHASHSNLKSTGSGAPSVSALDTAFTAMAKQQDPSTKASLNIEPSYLIVPKALDYTGRVLVSADLNPAEGTTTSFAAPNGFRGRLEVVSDARLDADSATAWYLAANQNLYDTVEVAFLDGVQEPYLEEQSGWNSDGVEYKVRIDAVAGALDFRGLYKNNG